MNARTIFCTGCGTRYEVGRDVPADENIYLMCGVCGRTAQSGVFSRGAPPSNQGTQHILAESLWPRVVVGHEVPSAQRAIASVLRQAERCPVLVRTGEQVLAACDPAMPSLPTALILDVAIPGIMAFEVIAQLRAVPATRSIPIVLLASVFERTRYKRLPTNLYGADAYLELHHVPDRLIATLDSCAGQAASDPQRLQAPVERARAAALRSNVRVDDADAAHALARRLLSDVALYHGDDVAHGIRSGDPFARLTASVDAARELFQGASPHSSIFDDELSAFASRLLERGALRRTSDGG